MEKCEQYYKLSFRNYTRKKSPTTDRITQRRLNQQNDRWTYTHLDDICPPYLQASFNKWILWTTSNYLHSGPWISHLDFDISSLPSNGSLLPNSSGTL